MNKIYIGNYNINKAYLGGDLTIKIFLGDNLVYPIEDAVAATYYDESGNTQTILCSNLATAGYLNYSDAQSIGSGFTSVVIDNCVQVIEMGGIGGGSWSTITSVTCGDSVQATSTDFLPSNTQIVVFGTGLTTVDRYSFELLHDLQSVTFNGTVPPSFHADWETDGNQTFIIYVPCNSIEAYRTALSGKTANLNDRLQCIPTVQNKWSLTFANGDVRSLECDASGDSFPRQIDNHDWTAPLTPFDATHAKSGVTSAVIGDCVAGILSDGFNGFTSLSSVTVNPNTMYAYGGYSGMTPDGCCAFFGDYSLVEFPYSSVLESIGRDSFHGCSGLTDATIASSCTYIGDEAFFDCTGLEKVVMEGSTPPVLGGDFVFWKIDSNAPSGVSQLDIDIEVPCDAVNTYKTAPRWSAYADRITCKTTPYEEQYLTFVAGADNMSVGLTSAGNNVYQYSTDSGQTWSNLANNESTTSVNSGQTIMFKAYNGIGTLTPSVSASVQGNVMSLLYGDNFYGQTTIENQNQFRGLFSNSYNLTSAENLILPATTLAQNCYYEMFRNCINLTTAPELPATTLVTNCYRYMFAGCTSLNYIKCLATNISAYRCTGSWVDGVAASGTFVKAASMSSWTTSRDGIPSNWTIQNDDGSPVDNGRVD